MTSLVSPWDQVKRSLIGLSPRVTRQLHTKQLLSAVLMLKQFLVLQRLIKHLRPNLAKLTLRFCKRKRIVFLSNWKKLVSLKSLLSLAWSVMLSKLKSHVVLKWMRLLFLSLKLTLKALVTSLKLPLVWLNLTRLHVRAFRLVT